MPTTYTPLATQTLSSNAATVTFSSIPQIYTDLVLIMNPAASSNADNVLIQFNGDTTGNYSSTEVSGNGTVASSTRVSNASSINITNRIGTTTTLGGLAITCHFMNYANATTYKSVLIRASQAGDTYPGTSAAVGLWRSTSPITSIVVKQSGSPNFIAGSTFSLYGIASAAVVSGAKATGGDTIATDGTYWYHAFRTSGTFTPSVALTCDYLVIAGGGGGGNAGGGAGGYRTATAQSLTTTGYTVTVGAGGAAFSGGAAGNGSSSTFNALTSTGGGGGGGNGGSGSNGGSGGGAAVLGSTVGSAGTGTAGQGNNGGSGSAVAAGNYVGAGGGGAGAVGGSTSGTTCGAGGAGSNAHSTWASVTGTGVSGYYAGGGGAAGNATTSSGGSGGGGNGDNASTGNGVANTGSGGGGGYSTYIGAGGSGLVIVRYPV